MEVLLKYSILNRWMMYLVIFGGGSVFICLLVIGLLQILFPDTYADITRALPRLVDVPSVQRDFDAVLQDIVEGRTDTLIEKREISSVHASRGRFFAGCITGTIEYTYGSSKEFASVLKEYSASFSSKGGWERKLEGTVFMSDRVEVRLQEVFSPDAAYVAGCRNHLVCYSVKVHYADPSLKSCSG